MSKLSILNNFDKPIIAHIRAIVKINAIIYNKNEKNKCGEDKLIVFDKLWETMKEKNISQYQLIKNYGISTGQLDRLRKNQNVNSYTLNTLCKILDCNLDDIAQYIKE